MRPSFWKYENNTYRGRVLRYHGHIVESVPCKEVRKNMLKAYCDAKKLMKKLKKCGQLKNVQNKVC